MIFTADSAEHAEGFLNLCFHASIFRKCRSETMMQYKGYYGVVQYDDEAKIFHGEVINTRIVITFQGTTVDEIENAFRDSVDDYLDWCQERNKEPEKPFSGKKIKKGTVKFFSLPAKHAKRRESELGTTFIT